MIIGVMEYWSVAGFPSLHYSSTPAMGKGKSGLLNTKPQLMAVYSIYIGIFAMYQDQCGFVILLISQSTNNRTL